MGNVVKLKAMRFTDLRTGDVDEGFVIYDDYDECFDYMLGGVPQDDRELLAAVARDGCGDVLSRLLEMAGEIGLVSGVTRIAPDEAKRIIEECNIDVTEELPVGLARKVGVCGGALCLENSRIPVWVLNRLYVEVSSKEKVLAAYPRLSEDELNIALAYAKEHEREIEEDELANDRE